MLSSRAVASVVEKWLRLVPTSEHAVEALCCLLCTTCKALDAENKVLLEELLLRFKTTTAAAPLSPRLRSLAVGTVKQRGMKDASWTDVWSPNAYDAIKLCNLRSLVDALSETNMQTLAEQLACLNIDKEELMRGFGELVFEKAVSSPGTIGPCARFCEANKDLSCKRNQQRFHTTRNISSLQSSCAIDGFVGIVCEICQETVDNGTDDTYTDAKVAAMDVQKSTDVRAVHRRFINAVEFYGELYAMGLLKSHQVTHLIDRLLDKRQSEHMVEALCRLLKAAASKLDERYKKGILMYVPKFCNLATDASLSAHSRDMVMEMLKSKEDSWGPYKGIPKEGSIADNNTSRESVCCLDAVGMSIEPVMNVVSGAATEASRLRIVSEQETQKHAPEKVDQPEAVSLSVGNHADDVPEAPIAAPLHQSLFEAVAANHGPSLQALLNAKAAVNDVDAEDRSPLFLAVGKNSTDCIRVLIKAGADVNIADNLSRLPLSVAAMHGYIDALQLLLQAGAPVNALNKYGQSALYLACQNRQSAAVEALIKAGAALDTYVPSIGTPLSVAIVRGDVRSATLLIDAKASLSEIGRAHV